MNWLFGPRRNPLHQSGTLAVLSLVVALVTGIYLLIFYRVGAPFESVLALHDQVLLGRWVRALHRYSSDLAVVATLLHALKMLLARRTWGPRTVAWITGVLLFLAVLFIGLTGFVMVWDTQALAVVQGLFRLLDPLPVFSEPPGRMISGAEPMSNGFFFAVMFLHVATPLGAAGLVYLHLSRLARPLLFPPRELTRLALVALVLFSMAVPLSRPEAADVFSLQGPVPLDLYYGFWIPVQGWLGAWPATALLGAVSLLSLLVPWTVRPGQRPAPSRVDERLCTGCTQCVQDCPFDALSMVERVGPGSAVVARVNPDACVSCGICAGSCAPMGVGPPGRTGRDQLREVEEWVTADSPAPGEVAVLACGNAIAGLEPGWRQLGCAGSLHTSVIEYLLRRGFAGVMVLSCPERDCRHREGPKWLEQRVYHDREAELQARVDRRRVRLLAVSPSETRRVRAALALFRRQLASLEEVAAEPHPLVEVTCDV
ncbi:MAG: hydrogenase iron-sulfur subunit [Candidatus Eremiobacterota bacterium]